MTQSGPAQALDAYLGDDSASLARALAHDESETLPVEAMAALDAWGLPRFYVPVKEGGALERYDDLVAMLRVVARRDLTLAIAHGKTFLGSIPVWIGGDDAQRAQLASIVLRGGPVSLALTERAHGGDLAACEVRAERSGNGYELSGEKWLINNATRCDALTVLARTGDAGPRGLSLFLVEKARLRPGSFATIDRIRTHGVRGADISGIRFHRTMLSEAARIGAEGEGMARTLLALQVTRPLCAGLSVGALDAALRIALRFARGRRLYGEAVADLPHARALLAGAFVDLAIAEVVTRTACRAIHVAPDQLAVLSAVTKVIVPAIADDALRCLAVVLGARHYLREGEAGAFQKILRDASLVGLFDGSTVVNLQALGLLAPGILGRDPHPTAPRVLAALFDHLSPLAPPNFAALRLSTRRDDVLQLLPAAVPRARERDASLAAPLEALLARLQATKRSIEEAVHAEGQRFARSAALFEHAEVLCALHAAATCVHAFLASDRGITADPAWLRAALDRLLARAGAPIGRTPWPTLEHLARELLAREADGRGFETDA